MGTGWWLVLGVVVLSALVAAYVDGTGRLRRRRGPGRTGDEKGGGSQNEPPPTG